MQFIQFADVPFALLQGFDDGAVLQALLDDGLYAAVALPDVPCVTAHAFHVEAAAEQEDRQYSYDNPRQGGVEQAEEEECGEQLDGGDDKGGDGSGQQAYDGGSVLLHPVDDVSGMKTFQFVPAALQQPGEEAVAQGVSCLYLHAGVEPGVGGTA